MWIGTLTCLQCNSPIITEAHSNNGFIPFDANVSSLPARCMAPWSDEDIQKFKRIISNGRRANGLRFNVAYFTHPPTFEEQQEKAAQYRRSFQAQGSRTDNDITRKHKMDVTRGFTTHRGSVEERITQDREFRLKYAKNIVNCAQLTAPASALLSRLTRLAFKTAIELGELSYESIGERNRRTNNITVSLDSDED